MSTETEQLAIEIARVTRICAELGETPEASLIRQVLRHLELTLWELSDRDILPTDGRDWWRDWQDRRTGRSDQE